MHSVTTEASLKPAADTPRSGKDNFDEFYLIIEFGKFLSKAQFYGRG